MDNCLLQMLRKREKPIRVGVAGAGRFSSGMICQTTQITGLEVIAASDVLPQYAVEAFQLAGFPDESILLTDNLSKAHIGIADGKRVVVEDPYQLCELDLDVIVDATGLVDFGAEFVCRAISRGKHVVMVNIEADSAIGPILMYKAQQAGVIYTLADGDQPSLAKGLYDWAETIGLEVRLIGKWSGIYSEAEASRQLAKNKAMMRETDIAYIDGTKNQMEMACIANMTGFAPDVAGMHKPRISLQDIPNVFRTREKGGILNRNGIVDVINARNDDGTIIDPLLQGGVFILVSSPHPLVRKQLGQKGLIMSEDGEVGIIYRPHHLIGVETPMSIIKAVILKEATGSPRLQSTAEVVTIAKRDLLSGEMLDGMGKETVRGQIVRKDESTGILPFGLAENVRVNRNIAKGTILTYDMLEQKGTSFIWKIREEMDQILI